MALWYKFEVVTNRTVHKDIRHKDILHQKLTEHEKNLEAFYIALMRPNLNEQCDSNVLTLFRNGIT